jgi:hypothetical protein
MELLIFIELVNLQKFCLTISRLIDQVLLSLPKHCLNLIITKFNSKNSLLVLLIFTIMFDFTQVCFIISSSADLR